MVLCSYSYSNRAGACTDCTTANCSLDRYLPISSLPMKDRKIEQLFPVTIGTPLQQRTVDSCSSFYSSINSHIYHYGAIDIGSLHGVITGIMTNRKGIMEAFPLQWISEICCGLRKPSTLKSIARRMVM